MTGLRDTLPRLRRRVRVPTILQMEAVECGAACLAMVLAHYQRYEPLENLRYACGVSRDGTSAAGIVKAARDYGLEAKGYSAEPADIGDFPLPFIVFWNFNHFVVIEGFTDRRVFLNDPATGPRTISTEEFDKAFTGVLLTFQPGPAFRRAGRPRRVLSGLTRRMRGVGAPLLFLVLTSCGLLVPGLAVPILSRIFVDYYLVQKFHDWLLPLMVGLVGAALLRGVLAWLRQHYLIRLQAKLALRGACVFFWRVLRLPVRFYSQRYAGDIASRVGLNDRLADLIAGDLAITGISLLTMTIYALIMVQYDIALTVIAVCFSTLNLIVFALVARNISDSSQRLLQEEGKLLGVSIHGIQMIESIKAGGGEDLFFSRWSGHLAKLINTEQNLSRSRLILGIFPLLIGMLSSTAVLILGGFKVMDGSISIGTLVAFQALMISFQAPVVDLVHLGNQVQEAAGSINRLDDILANEIDPAFTLPSPPAPVAPPALPGPPTALTRLSASAIADRAPATRQIPPERLKLTGQVRLEDVTFGFSPTHPPLIENFSLTLEPGTRIALVGASGSGKSTVGKLIAGLYEPWSGRILFDGQPIETIPRRVLRSSLAMVDQDILLFGGEISDNISLWDPTLPEDRITQAARDAQIHDEIASRPDNYASRISEDGRNFSGGQRQRIEIARALAVNPSTLILDEATSALDTAVEKNIIDNVRRRGCSCLIIAHRLSTIRDCDEIIVLDNGKIAERGRHDDLIRANGLYRQLVES